MDALPYTLILNRRTALHRAQDKANANDAPVAVVEGYGWYRIVEHADDYDDMIRFDGYTSVAVLAPEAKA